MEDKLDKKMDHLINKMIKQNELESPSKDFTVNLMSKIETLNSSKPLIYKPLIYKPLINKTVWFLILIGSVMLTIYTFYVLNTSSITIINYDKFMNYIPNISIPKLTLSKITTNSILLIGVIITVQFSLLKNYFNKRTNL